MNAAQQRFYLFLQSLPGAGPVALKQLLKHYPSAEIFWRSPTAPLIKGAQGRLNTALRAAWRSGENGPAWQRARDDQARLQDDAVHLISWRDAGYPPLLQQIPDCPALLYVRGNIASLCRPQLAIVGSRNASRAGLATARDFARELAAAGIVVCSGLALGIDGAAHQGALDAMGSTTAVLGTGIDTIYPLRHADLAGTIIENGALISEFPLGTLPRPGHFPRRNRIIAGMCVGTLVVEAALRSGSLITARLALDYNREVFAVPGSIHSPLCKGNHALIREGAKLVETTEHVLEEVISLLPCHTVAPPQLDQTSRNEPPVHLVMPSQKSAQHVLKAIDECPTSMDAIVDRTGMVMTELAEVLLDLEMSGWVEMCAGGWQRTLALGT
jgi:DNA processing protein